MLLGNFFASQERSITLQNRKVTGKEPVIGTSWTARGIVSYGGWRINPQSGGQKVSTTVRIFLPASFATQAATLVVGHSTLEVDGIKFEVASVDSRAVRPVTYPVRIEGVRDL